MNKKVMSRSNGSIGNIEHSYFIVTFYGVFFFATSANLKIVQVDHTSLSFLQQNPLGLLLSELANGP